MDTAKDPYVTLGVLPTAEDVVIRAAYKALALRYHPDRFDAARAPQGARSMSEINAAYALISNPDQRKVFDSQAGSQASDSWFSDDPDDLPPTQDPLAHDWAVAVGIYPDLEELESHLARITWRLAYSYRAYLLDSKLFAKRRQIAEDIRNKFFAMHFGDNTRLVAFATGLIECGQKQAAMALHAASHALGSNADPDQVITQIKNTYALPFAEADASLMRRLGISYDGKQYQYGQYRYDKLSDAADFAELQAGKKLPGS